MAKTTTMTVRIPVALKEELEAEAEKQGISVNQCALDRLQGFCRDGDGKWWTRIAPEWKTGIEREAERQRRTVQSLLARWFQLGSEGKLRGFIPGW